MPVSGPLLLAPRLDPKPWGGHALLKYGFDLPNGERIGEALITAAEARILNGEHAGRTLGEVVTDDPRQTIGERGLVATRGRPLFPLLIKLIDADDDLSIQVHPSDDTAPPGSLGKTEAWHVLAARPGSVLYLGFEIGVDAGQVERLVRDGQSISHLLRSIPAYPGMTVFLPAGAVHALGAGVLIYEIQQPSQITYRLDDWGRVDATGKSRDLHIDEGFAVLNAELRPDQNRPEPLATPSGTRTRLTRCPLFAAEQLTLSAGDVVRLDGGGAPQVFTCLAGRVDISADDATVAIVPGQTATVLANSDEATLTAREDCILIRAWIDPAA